jgi:hypothetical protein
MIGMRMIMCPVVAVMGVAMIAIFCPIVRVSMTMLMRMLVLVAVFMTVAVRFPIVLMRMLMFMGVFVVMLMFVFVVTVHCLISFYCYCKSILWPIGPYSFFIFW